MPGPGQPPAPGPKGGAPAAKAGAGGFKLNLTKKQQQNLIIGVVLIGAIGYVYYAYLFTPNLKTIKDRSAALEQKKKDLEDARNMVSKYDEFLKRATEINTKSDFINKRLPSDMSISDTIKEITEKATESNINIVGFEPSGKPAKKDDYYESEINMHFDTNYKDLGDFLTRIGYIERLTNPAKISIRSKNGDASGVSTNDSITVDITIKIYSFINS